MQTGDHFREVAKGVRTKFSNVFLPIRVDLGFLDEVFATCEMICLEVRTRPIVAQQKEKDREFWKSRQGPCSHEIVRGHV